MAYRILGDGHVERATVVSLGTLGHDVVRLVAGAELGLGADDEAMARLARDHDRLLLTQHDEFSTELRIEETAGKLFQREQLLSARDVVDAVHELKRPSTSQIWTSSPSAQTGCEWSEADP